LQTLEPPGSDEVAITLDIALSTEQLVTQIEQQLHLYIAEPSTHPTH